MRGEEDLMGTCLVVEDKQLATENLKDKNSTSKPRVTKKKILPLRMNKKQQKVATRWTFPKVSCAQKLAPYLLALF